MKKLERYELNSTAYYCADEDVAQLEASHAELLVAAKEIVDYERMGYDGTMMIHRLRAAIAKAKGEVMP